MRRYSFWTIAGLSVLLMSAGCASNKVSFIDPVAYCSAVDTIDHPDERYVGPASPEWMEFSLGKRMKIPIGPSAEALEPIAWRCAGGHIIACSVGTGMPCDKKPSTSRVPTRVAIEFCRAFPDIDRPLPNLGPELSAYQWICSHGFPRLIGFQPDLDPEGFFRRYWFEIPPDDALSASLDDRLTPETEAGLRQHVVEILAKMNSARAMIHVEIAPRSEQSDAKRCPADIGGRDAERVAICVPRTAP